MARAYKAQTGRRLLAMLSAGVIGLAAVVLVRAVVSLFARKAALNAWAAARTLNGVKRK